MLTTPDERYPLRCASAPAARRWRWCRPACSCTCSPLSPARAAGSRNTIIRTTGDAVQDRPLADIGGKGLFAKEIHEALADGRIDFAVHSLKDLETELPPGIVLACTLQREDARDALILGAGLRRRRIRPTRSPRCRRARWSARPRCGARRSCCTRGRTCASPPSAATCRRGWRKVRDGDCAASLLALAGLRRLGLEDPRRRSCWTRTRWCRPPARASSASPCAPTTPKLRELLAAIEDPEAKAVSTAERAMLAELDGSCRTPIGGHARLLPDGELHLTGLVARADGSFLLKRSLRGRRPADAARIGAELGASLRADSPADMFG